MTVNRDAGSPPYRHGARFSRDEVERLIELKARSGLSWTDIGERIGRSPKAISKQVSRYKRGNLRFRRDYYDALYDKIAAEVIAGQSISACSRKYGIIRSSISMSLTRRGLDQEVRDEMRRDGLSL